MTTIDTTIRPSAMNKFRLPESVSSSNPPCEIDVELEDAFAFFLKIFCIFCKKEVSIFIIHLLVYQVHFFYLVA